MIATTGEAQKHFAVDYSVTLEKLKDLRNVNGGPYHSVAAYQDAGIHLIRSQDFNGAVADYINYASFWKNGNINAAFDPKDSTQYHWLQCDIKMDSVVQFGMEPFFRLGISFAYTKDTIFNRPPYDANGTTFANFAELSKRTVMHYNAKWDKGFSDNVKYWEIWNEPDGGFWHGDSLSFYRLYVQTAESLKHYDPSLIVGGPGVLSGSVVTKRQWIDGFLRYAHTANAPMDFFSWHLYGQHNPYGIAVWGDYVRHLLDSTGYPAAKSIVSEMNIDLGQTGNPDLDSPKGAAFIASSLLSVQMGKVDNILLYRGEGIMNMFLQDSAGLPGYTWNGLGLRAFSVLYKTAPNRIAANGSVMIGGEQNAKKDTTNLMVLAGRSDDQRTCTIVISNYNSTDSAFTVDLSHLPWNSSGTVTVTKNIVKGPSDRFTESSWTIPGTSAASLNVTGLPAPSVLVLRLQYNGAVTSVSDARSVPGSFSLHQNYPNPFNPSTAIGFTLSVSGPTRLTVYDAVGREVAELVNEDLEAGVYHERTFDAARLSSGIYFARLTSSGQQQIRRMLLLK